MRVCPEMTGTRIAAPISWGPDRAKGEEEEGRGVLSLALYFLATVR
jgi:hypothetical protein